jgi:RNA polymerase sigma factor (sigma-70 family)
MALHDSTSWTVIRGAAAGDRCACDQFVRRYTPLIRDCLASRWRGRPHLADLEDAIQDVVVKCLEPGGPLERADPGRPNGFKAFLKGVIFNVARQYEDRRARENGRLAGAPSDLEQVPDDEASQSHHFDRNWARALMREAAERQAERASEAGPEAIRRVELLRLLFHEGLKIGEVATCWGIDVKVLYREHTTAKQEFKAALQEVVHFHHPGTPAEVERECLALLALLG